MVTYLSWWFLEEPKELWRAIKIVTVKVLAAFSVTLLLCTLFDPWKKDIFYVENASLDLRFKIWLNNLVSRLIGCMVRLLTILTGLILTFLTFAVLIIIFLLWLSMPLLIVFLLFNGLREIING